MYFIIAWIIGLIVTWAGCLRSFVAFDRLLRIEWAEHRDQWESDGRPGGFFWRPQGAAWWWPGSFARWRAFRHWVSGPRAWIDQDDRASELRMSIRTSKKTPWPAR